jgi:uncharacterized repeat protein (TIGR04138 family)
MPMNELQRKTLEQVVQECGRYPIEAFEFVRHGLNHTVHQIHGERRREGGVEKPCHVTGQQLSWGLRNYAIEKYGLLAKTVLNHWGIVRTNDFGRIVFAMVESKLMQKTDEDDIRDFHNVFDFIKAFEAPNRPLNQPKAVFSI